jgi:hypothetical protein
MAADSCWLTVATGGSWAVKDLGQLDRLETSIMAHVIGPI